MYIDETLINRPVTMEDVESITSLINVAEQSLNGCILVESADEMRSEWEMPGWDNRLNTMAWFNGQEPIAYAEFYDLIKPTIRMNGWFRIHPDYENDNDLYENMLDWFEKRARQNLPTVPEGVRVVLHQGVYSTHTTAITQLEKAGYQHVRSYYKMIIDLTDDIPEPVWPEGITIRALTEGDVETLYKLIQVQQEAFKDHWGFVPDKIEAAVARWKHWLANDPLTDITCLYMVEEGTQPVASLFNWPRTSDDPRKGWIGSLGVLRPWRKHGLGRALLLHSFQEFKKRGLLRAGLGVDASNLTGALRLYEKAGMHVEQTTFTFEVELQPGKNLMTQTLES